MKGWHKFALQSILCNYKGKLTCEPDGVHLCCEMSGPITPDYVKELESVMDDWFQERASIKTFDGNMDKEIAEAQAFEELKKEIVK